MKNQARINYRSHQNKSAASRENRSRTRTIITTSAATVALLGLLSGFMPVVQPRAIRLYQKKRSIVNESLPQDRPGRGTTDLLKDQVAKNLARAPLSFQPNLGQTDSRVRFLSRANGYNLFLTATGAVFDLPTASARSADRTSQSFRATKSSAEATRVSIEMELVGAEPGSKFEPQDALPGKVNYFIGKDPEKWQTNVPTYQRISQANVYAGINVSYYGTGEETEYDFVVNPGSDPKMIRLGFKGASNVRVDKAGDLLLQLEGGVLKQRKPVAYQNIDGRRREVTASYIMLKRNEVGFEIGEYDSTRPLVIDPVLLYSTYLGGTGVDEIVRVTTNSSSVFVSGTTNSAIAFPATPGAYQTSFGGPIGNDAFVARLDQSSTPAFTYITYLGGSGNDFAYGIAADEANNAYVAGDTWGGGFPTTPGSFRSSPLFRTVDGFVTKLNSSGSALVYSTYIGGSQGYDYLRDIDVDASGSAFVTGHTNAIDFPMDESGVTRTTPGGLPHNFRSESDNFDALVLGLNPVGNDLIYTTFLGGPNPMEGDSGLGIAVGLGCQFVTGVTHSRTDFPLANAFQSPFGGGDSDAFVTRLEFVDGQLFLRYSTYLGGNNPDQGNDIVVDSTGKAYVIGSTNSANFPTRNAFQAFRGGTCGASPRFVCNDVFVVKIDPYLSGNSSFLFGSYLGGRENDLGNGIAIDFASNIYLTGETNSDDFPVRGFIPPDNSPLRSNYLAGGDVFITKLSPSGDTFDYVYSAYLAAEFFVLTHQRLSRQYGKGVAVDAAGYAYVVGQTSSNRFSRGSVPFPNYQANSDGFVAKIRDSPLDRLTPMMLLIEGLIKGGLLPPKAGHDLLVKLDLVIKQAEKGNIRPAINQVENFISQVNDLLKSGLLPAAQGKILLDGANQVLDELRQFDSPKKNPK